MTYHEDFVDFLWPTRLDRPCIVFMDRPLQAHVLRRFSDFLMAS
jgi:hypothetical protein